MLHMDVIYSICFETAYQGPPKPLKTLFLIPKSQIFGDEDEDLKTFVLHGVLGFSQQ